MVEECDRNVNPATMTLEQIRIVGLQTLSRELGPVGLVRFLQQFEMGYGDYTTEGHSWLRGLAVQDISEAIERESPAQG